MGVTMTTDGPAYSFTIKRLEVGGWRVIEHRENDPDRPVADFVSQRDAEEWVKWKLGIPRMNPYA